MVEISIGIALEVGAQGGDAGVAVEAQPFAHEVVGADEIRAEPDSGGDSLSGGVLVSGEPELLDSSDAVAEALPFERVVVEVRPGRAAPMVNA